MSSYKRGDHAGVLQACARAPQEPKSQVTVHALRASSLAKLGRPEHALREIHAAFELGARSTELCRLAAAICVAREELGAAREWIDRALNEDPTAHELLHFRRQIVFDMHLLSGLYEHQELVVRLDPQSVEARERLIESYLTVQEYALAEEHLDVALAQSPRRASLHIDKAVVCIETGRAAAAADALQRALALTEGMPERLRIARLFIKAGALELALRTAQENHALAPDAAEVRLQCGFFALWQGDPRAADTWCRDLHAPTPGLARLRAAIAFVDRRHEAALTLATEATAREPTDPEAHAVRGAALFRLGRDEEAHRSALTASRATLEWLPAAQLVLIGSRPTPPQYEVAELVELLPPLFPKSGLVPQTEGRGPSQPMLDAIDSALHRLSGNFSSALTFVPEGSRTWSSFSTKPPARLACLRVAKLISVRPWAWVAECLGALATRYPRSPYVHTYTAEVWLWCGEYAACEAECRKALALTKTEGSRWAWVGLGAALMMQEHYAEALEVFAESNRLMKPGAPLLAYRGETLRRCGELDAATHDLTRALALAPTRISAWLNLGLIAHAQRRPDEVRDIYARLRAHVPQLVRDIERDLAGHVDTGERTGDAMAAMFTHALRAMRGNRSSGRIIYWLRDGVARVLTGRALPST